MKKVTIICMIALLIGTFLCCNVSGQELPTVAELVERWEESAYPEDVAYVRMETVNQKEIYFIGLIGRTAGREQELQKMVSNPDYFIFESTDYKYSYNAVKRASDELENRMREEMASGDGDIYLVGWLPENRVLVEVKAESLERYRQELQQEYGDLVTVEAGEPVVALPGAHNNWLFVIGIIGDIAAVILASGIIVYLFYRRRAKRKHE